MKPAKKNKWWLGTTLLETLVLFSIHSIMIWKMNNFGTIKYCYLLTSLLQVVLRAVGYRGTWAMTSDWFKSKRHANMGLAYSFYLPQIFLMALHINYDLTIPFFRNSSFSPLIMDYIYISYCMNLIVITIIAFSESLYSSKIFIIFLCLLYPIIELGVYNKHYSFHIPCIMFAVLVFYLSRYFPECFTYGEYSIFCQVIVLNSLLLFQKYYIKIIPYKKLFKIQLSTSIILSCIFASFATIVIYSLSNALYNRAAHRWGILFEFFSFICSCSVLLLSLQIALARQNIIQLLKWFLDYIFVSHRFCLVMWLLFCVLITIVYLWIVFKNPNICQATILRKFFHFIVVFAYIPAIILDVEFLSIASSLMLWLFCVNEAIRLSKFTKISSVINSGITPYLTKSNSWFIVPNHFLLLIATSLPLWTMNFVYFGSFSNSHNAYRKIYLLSTLGSVGIGDAVASVVGVKFGRHKLCLGRKSIEGMLASIVFQFTFFAILFRIFSKTIFPLYFDLIFLICAVVTSLLEALTMQEDNIIVPVITISLMIALFPSTDGI
ncbi:Dolichol kinase [Thelohanellus kitauei]|uniref:dolichol kinase n=1 Tax=Thelohanellus kitauei TaxID=669202 RepID=A0A0C2MTN9_THEKT|nr:Dolichol kinase [Thelohanellus kitauei]